MPSPVAAPSAPDIRVAIPLDHVVRWLARAAAFLIAAFLVTQYVTLELGAVYFFGLVPLFDFQGEGNLPRFFQAMVLIACALAFLGIGADDAARQARRWVVLGLVFLWFGIDEAAQLESRISLLAEKIFAPSFQTQAVTTMGLGGVLLGLWLVPLLTDLSRATLVSLALAAGAIAIGWTFAALGALVAAEWGFLSFAHALAIAGEKGFAMAAAILLLRAALQHLKRSNATVRLFAA